MRHVNPISQLLESYKAYYAYAAFKIRIAAWIGMAALPGYYFIWLWIEPQPYENLTLRLVGTVLCLAIALSPYWPDSLARLEVPLAYFTTVYCLPFFITLMTLMNGATQVWQLTSLAAVLYIVFLFDTLNAVVATVVGIVAAFGLYAFSAVDVAWQPSIPAFLLVLFFAVLSVAFLNYGESIVVREKINAASSTASHVAHEIRTPLLSIRFEAEKIAELFPRLRTGSQSHHDRGQDVPIEALLQQFENSINRIDDNTKAAGVVIDMLLTNVGQQNDLTDVGLHSIVETIKTAVERYPFKGEQKGVVRLELDSDFTYSGSETLMVHVIFNLLKNALRAVARKGEGTIKISVAPAPGYNKLIISDTGSGIALAAQPFIFVPFYTLEPGSAGTGIGLSFCRKVIDNIGGAIDCSSVYGEYTSFTISLPVVTKS